MFSGSFQKGRRVVWDWRDEYKIGLLLVQIKIIVLNSNLQLLLQYLHIVIKVMQSNIFTATVSRLRSNVSVQELIVDFKDQVKPKIAKGTTLQPQNLIKKFNTLQKRYNKNKGIDTSMEWQESQRKLFLLFILAYCHLEFKKLNEISQTEWNDISICFHHKNILLLQYQARTYQKNSERVSWDHSQERLLEELIKSQLNGKWSEISRVLYFKSGGEYYKTAKQCRQHWLNHMNGDIVKGDWSIDEDLIILTFVQKEGHHWSRVVEKLSRRRTEHMIKNRFTSLVNCAKKLMIKKKSTLTQQQIIVFLMKELKSNKADLEFMRSREEISERLQTVSLVEQNIKSQKQQIISNRQKTEMDFDQKMMGRTQNSISFKQMNSMKTIEPSNQPQFNHSFHHSYSQKIINLNGSYDYAGQSSLEMGQPMYLIPQNQTGSYELKALVNPINFFIKGDCGKQDSMGSMRDQIVGENSCFNEGGYYGLAEQSRGCCQLETIKNKAQQ